MINVGDIKVLRDETELPMGECKKALEEAGGDRSKALEILRARAGVTASKKAGRTLGAGTVASYVHTTKTLGAMVELLCETDFVAKNEEFQTLARDIAMHISVTNPADIATLIGEPFIKDESRTIANLIENAVAKFGEKIEVGHLARFSVLQS